MGLTTRACISACEVGTGLVGEERLAALAAADRTAIRALLAALS